MAKALAPGQPAHRRALFGALDADGWAWAGVKAAFWFLVLILMLGYIPDRAYYFTVERTIDVGILAWSPVNFCPAGNGALPCPAPAGAIVPWQASPAELALPAARIDGTAAQVAKELVFAGGSDGKAATADTYVATVDNDTFGQWSSGPALPEARSSAGIAVLSGTAYLVGGDGPDGAPTSTVWSLAADPDSGALGAWTPVDGVALPAARSGSAVLAVSDGLLVIGGRGPDGQPTATVWKSTLDSTGKLGDFEAQPDLPHAVVDASAALVGTNVWVYGGSDANGPTTDVQRSGYGTVSAPAGASAAPSPQASAEPVQGLQGWADAAALPAPRTDAIGFAANGAMYLVGGSDGQAARSDLYWAVPTAAGDLADGWHHLDATDLSGGLSGAEAVVSGSTVFVLGGSTASGPSTTSLRASLAPEEPLFQLGAVGLVIPALHIPGEIGQQLGYLSAAGAGTLDFAILVVIGYAFNHKRQIGAWRERRREAREAARRA